VVGPYITILVDTSNRMVKSPEVITKTLGSVQFMNMVGLDLQQKAKYALRHHQLLQPCRVAKRVRRVDRLDACAPNSYVRTRHTRMN
jgi:hypothetical protein